MRLKLGGQETAMEKQFDDFSTAFDYCREADKPVAVRVGGERWKLYPSGQVKRLPNNGIQPTPESGQPKQSKSTE